MILDAQLRFSNAQAVTADARSTNTLDLLKPRKFFVGQAFCILALVNVGADFTTGDETYSFQLRTDDNTDFTSPTVLSTNTILAASLAAGAKVIIPAPVNADCERYLELYYDVGGTTPTITVTAFLCPAQYIDMYSAYADAISIS